MAKPATNAPRTTSRLGAVNVTRIGVPRFDWRDPYHLVLSLNWPQFFAFVIGAYLLINLVFTGLYLLGDHAIANARPGAFADAFFFSVETLATVGYGFMNPGSTYGHLVATTEILSGMLSMAVITGLVFARFARPKARVLFSRVAVIAPFEGKPTLMLRAANQRHNFVVEAEANLTLVRQEMTAEGIEYRRFHTLRLERRRSAVFALTWTIMHVIDESSPLFGVSGEELERTRARFLISIAGIDEVLAATVHARNDYSAKHVHFGHRFADVLEQREDGHTIVHLDRFHDVEALAS